MEALELLEEKLIIEKNIAKSEIKHVKVKKF
jgi:hypothetical protein